MTLITDRIETKDIGPAETHLRLSRVRGRPGAQPVLLLHGSSFPSSICYTVPIGGRSWLADLAEGGFDSWALDIRGYGGSWRPDDDGERVADTAQAVADLRRALDHIRAETGAPEVDVVGWSWGCAVAGLAATKGAPIRRLALHAPQWLRDTPSPMVTDETLTRSYRTVATEGLLDRLAARANPNFLAPLRDVLSDTTLVVPTGSARDIATDWMSGRPSYEPAEIPCPTLVVVGAADADTPPDMARIVHDRLTGDGHRFAMIPDGTHYCPFEPARERLFHEVRAFLAGH